MKGENPETCVFKNVGGKSGPTFCFQLIGSANPPYPEPFTDILFDSVGFDMNGLDSGNFAGVVGVKGASQPATHITMRRLKVWDSVLGDAMFTARNRQRQYLIGLYVEDVLIENCDLSGGGRIKVGRPGKRMVVRNNVLRNVNDNAITFADSGQAATVNEDILVEGNSISNPIGSGIFIGADGERAGYAGKTFRNVMVRNNTIQGDFGTAGITLTTTDIFENIVVHDNIVRKTGSSGRFVVGIVLGTSEAISHPTRYVTIENNRVSAEEAGAMQNGAVFLKPATNDTCVVTGNTCDSGSERKLALRLRGPYQGTLFANMVIGAVDRQSSRPDENVGKLAIVGATAGSTTDGDAANTYDGRLATGWTSGPALSEAWIRFDLGSVKTIKLLKLKMVKGNTTAYPIAIEVSTDAATWTGVRATMSLLDDGLRTYDVANTQGRYVRVRTTAKNSDGANQLGIAEAEVYGEKP
jgi:hypothetical protein